VARGDGPVNAPPVALFIEALTQWVDASALAFYMSF
jgi:hypothetical protein